MRRTGSWETLLINSGVPESVRSLVRSFGYHDLDSLRQVLEQNPGAVGCVLLEAASVLAGTA